MQMSGLSPLSTKASSNTHKELDSDDIKLSTIKGSTEGSVTGPNSIKDGL
jgi:hypothetical protein